MAVSHNNVSCLNNEDKEREKKIDPFSDSGFFSDTDKIIKSDIENGFPGGVILVYKNGKILGKKAYGYKLRYNKEGLPLSQPEEMTTHTRFDLASNTKMYAVVFAMMFLIHQGKVDVNKPVSYYLPEYTGYDTGNPSQRRDDILVKDLLTHRAGYEPFVKFYDEKSIGPELYSQERNRTLKLLLTKLPFQRQRGGNPVYSDLDFMVLTAVIERITGQPLDEYLDKEIYTPLGLKNTGFNPKEKKLCAATELAGNTRQGAISFENAREKTLQGEVHDENAYYSMGGISGHAGLFSTVDDLAILLQLLLNGGSYKGKTYWTKDIQRTFIKPISEDDTYCEGGWRRSGSAHYAPFGEFAPPETFGHTGFTGTLTLIDLKNNLFIIWLTNAVHTLFKDGVFLGKTVYPSGKYGKICDSIYKALKLDKLTYEKRKTPYDMPSYPHSVSDIGIYGSKKNKNQKSIVSASPSVPAKRPTYAEVVKKWAP